MAYSNPQSLLTPIDFKLSGTAAGAAGSIRDAYAYSNMDADMRDNDLNYLASLNKYQNQMSDNPLIEQQRQNEMSLAQQEGQDWQSGVNKEVYSSAKEAKVAANQATTAAEKLKQSISAGDDLVSLKQYIDEVGTEEPGLGLLSNPEHQKNIDNYRSRIKAAGLNLPEGNFSTPQEKAFLDAKVRSYLNSREMLQKRMLMAEQYSGKQAVEQIKAEALRDVSGQRSETAKYVANLRFADDKTAEAALTRLRNKEGPYTPEEVVNLKQLLEREFDKTSQAKDNMTNFFLDPNIKPHAEAAKKAGLDYVKSPSQYYEAVRKSYVERNLTELVKVHSVTGGQRGGLSDAQLAPPSGQEQPQPQATVPQGQRQVSGGVGEGQQGGKFGSENNPIPADMINEKSYESLPPGTIYISPTTGKRLRKPFPGEKGN